MRELSAGTSLLVLWPAGQVESERDVRVELQNTKTLIGAEPWFRLAYQKSDS